MEAIIVQRGAAESLCQLDWHQRMIESWGNSEMRSIASIRNDLSLTELN